MHAAQVEDMLTRARSGLTAREQIDLYGDMRRSAAVCASSTLSASVDYDTALAYLAEGFTKVRCSRMAMGHGRALAP